MKKFLISIMTLTIILTLVSCGKPAQTANGTTTEAQTNANSPTETENAEEEQTEFFVTEEAADNLLTTEKNTVPETTKKRPNFHAPTTRENTSETKTTESKTNKPETTKVTTTKVTTTVKNEIQVTYNPEKDIRELHNTINNYRKQNGLSPITLDPELCQLAYKRACEQIILSGHTRPDGSDFYTILDEYGYPYSSTGENLCYLRNFPVETAFEQWKKSPSHNENMLYSEWTKAGLALYEKNPGEYEIALIFVS